MTKIDIYSGFLGAGKTTLIKKMISEAYKGQKLVLIENEFGQIGIDSGFLQDSGINITEMNSGCICCSLVGDFGKALEQVLSQYDPDRVIIEPSGVGKLSDVIAAVEKVTNENVTLGHVITVVDAGKVKVYMKNFGEFYNNQIENAAGVILSRTDSVEQKKLEAAVELIKQLNEQTVIITTPWNELTGEQIEKAIHGHGSVSAMIEELEHHHHHHEHEEGCCCGHHHEQEHHHHHEHEEGCCCGHHHEQEHHHHHDHEEGCCCGHHHEQEHHHHHDQEEGCCCGHHHEQEHHHHHDHEEGCCCGHNHEQEHHQHHHDHEEGCSCGHHHDHDHHHHHADEVFTSWGTETVKKFTETELHAALNALDTGCYGFILRAKGIVACADGGWLHFDYVPEEKNIRMGSAAVTGKLCVIGANLDENSVKALFGV